MTINEKLQLLRDEMKKRNIDIYIVPTSDFHQSEYVGEYFKTREFLTGFTGSAGTAVVTPDEALLWTDGRYFVQAEQQLADTEFQLQKMGEPEVPTIVEYLNEKIPQEGCIGFDGRVVSARNAEKFKEAADAHNARLEAAEDLVGLIWKDRPERPKTRAWVLDEKYAGESVTDKLMKIRKEMEQQDVNVHVISSLTDIAWILNLRGNDIAHVPVVLAYLIITGNNADLFIQDDAVDQKVIQHLAAAGVRVFGYDTFFETLHDLTPSVHVWMDLEAVNYRMIQELDPHIKILDKPNASERMKAVKNKTELANSRIAHKKDGVAMVRFLYWLKTHVGTENITEYSAGQKLDQLRAEEEGFLDISFDTICAYGSNAAIVHYQAQEKTAAELKPEGMLLVDSGGHYIEGTTDVTRTIVLGSVGEEEKKHFTAVCISNLRLAAAKFLYGCTGVNLDILAREPLWKYGLDFRHGTGHGVGNLLNVHEGPNVFRWRAKPERFEQEILEEGMITSDEPGLYFEGKYGIRTENEIVCRKAEKNDYGQFMEFETLTYVPIDLNAIDPALMSDEDLMLLNRYHEMVYETLQDSLDKTERQWLYMVTRPISRGEQ